MSKRLFDNEIIHGETGAALIEAVANAVSRIEVRSADAGLRPVWDTVRINVESDQLSRFAGEPMRDINYLAFEVMAVEEPIV